MPHPAQETLECTLLGHKYINEVQTVAQMFFPRHRFVFRREDRPPTTTGYAIKSVLKGGAARGLVTRDSTEIAAHAATYDGVLISDRRAVMLALFFALKTALPKHTPWGALTGIRPAKLVGQWLHTGMTCEAIEEVLVGQLSLDAPKAQLAIQVAKTERGIAREFFLHNTQSLYISIPFCPSRCAYCSFNHEQKPPPPSLMEVYVDTLTREIKTIASTKPNILSVYIGGGTPTALPPPLLERVLFAARDTAPTCLEFTVEAGRPDTITRETLKLLRDYNTTRIAINPQTMNDATLKRIGRSHTSEDFLRAFAHARDMGFGLINTDIIAGLPGEGLRDTENTMASLEKLSPENITVHTLSIKRASRMSGHAHEYAQTDAQEVSKMLDAAHAACAGLGQIPYYLYRQKNTPGLFENVGFSAPGHFCLYNVAMMAELHTVFGAGAGAVTKHVLGSRITREFNPKPVRVYLERKNQS